MVQEATDGLGGLDIIVSNAVSLACWGDFLFSFRSFALVALKLA